MADLKRLIEEKKALLAAQAAAIEQEMAELAQLERLAAKHNLVLAAPSAPTSNETHTSEVAAKPVIPIPEPSAPALPKPDVTVHFDGTVTSLVKAYRVHTKSPYHGLRLKVRANYDGVLNRLINEIGTVRIADLNRDKVQKLYDGWAATGKIALAYALVGRFRIILSFGMNVLDDPACTRLYSIMHTMRFPLPQKRDQRLTRDHVGLIREVAHDVGWHSIALAQVLQFELKLRQVEIIGEWVPRSSPEESDVIFGEEKWVRGLRWEQIDSNLILHHVTATLNKARKKEITVDLKDYPTIIEELEWVGKIPKSGPVVLCEFKGLPTEKPYTDTEYRRKWRIIADKAGLPKGLRNSDSFRGEDLDQTLDVVPHIEERFH